MHLLADEQFEQWCPPGYAGGSQFLAEIESPRASDCPQFGPLIDQAAQGQRVNPLLLLATAQREQSFLWLPHVEDYQCDWALGCGVRFRATAAEGRFRGLDRQVKEAASAYRQAFERAGRAHLGQWFAVASQPFRLLSGEWLTPQTRADAALLTYCPDSEQAAIALGRIFHDLEERLTMPKLHTPVTDIATCDVNSTPHGRSLMHCQDAPDHNVFKGYRHWEQTGRCVGDAVDLGGSAGQPVYAVADAIVTYFSNDNTKKEVLFLTWSPDNTAVYAHIEVLPQYAHAGAQVKRGQVIGHLKLLNWPHLHFELWLNGQALTASTPEALRAKLVQLCDLARGEVKVIDIMTNEILARFPGQWELAGTAANRYAGDHLADQGKLYLRPVGGGT